MGCKLNKNNRKDHLEKRKSQPRGKGYNLPIAHIVELIKKKKKF